MLRIEPEQGRLEQLRQPDGQVQEAFENIWNCSRYLAFATFGGHGSSFTDAISRGWPKNLFASDVENPASSTASK
jgi:hypothetical protein